MTASLSEFKVDIDYLRMIADFYDRKCPCWGGKYSCPCIAFIETKKCRCGAVRSADDPKAEEPRFKSCRVNFQILAEIARIGYHCPEERQKTCFCEEFLHSGQCKLHVFEKLADSK